MKKISEVDLDLLPPRDQPADGPPAVKSGAVCLQLAAEEGPISGPATVEVLDEEGKQVIFLGNRTRLRVAGCAVLERIPLGEAKARVTIPGHDSIEVPLRAEPGRVARITALIPEGKRKTSGGEP